MGLELRFWAGDLCPKPETRNPKVWVVAQVGPEEGLFTVAGPGLFFIMATTVLWC